jgi:hypothetical protein
VLGFGGLDVGVVTWRTPRATSNLESTYPFGSPVDLCVARLAEELTVAELVVTTRDSRLLVMEFRRANPAMAVVRTRTLRAFARPLRPLTG